MNSSNSWSILDLLPLNISWGTVDGKCFKQQQQQKQLIVPHDAIFHNWHQLIKMLTQGRLKLLFFIVWLFFGCLCGVCLGMCSFSLVVVVSPPLSPGGGAHRSLTRYDWHLSLDSSNDIIFFPGEKRLVSTIREAAHLKIRDLSF